VLSVHDTPYTFIPPYLLVGLGMGWAGVPEPLRSQLQRLAHTVFTTSYIGAMRSTVVLPVALLLLCAMACAVLLRPQPAAPSPAAQPSPAEAAPPGSLHDHG
jgi:hypothetical protein